MGSQKRLQRRRERLRSLKVLLAEDNRVNQLVAMRMVQNLGVTELELVENGLLALQACEGKEYDVVLMDCHMPEMDGFEATEKIRDFEKCHPKRRRVPIVAVTASALAHERDMCFKAGMDHFLTKPIRPRDLEEVLWVIYGDEE